LKSPALAVTSAEHLVHQRCVGPPRHRGLLGLRILAAATICIALVICDVLRIDLMRRRKSRGLGMGEYSCYL